MGRRVLGLVSWCLSGVLWAADVSPLQPKVPTTSEEAVAQRALAETARADAERVYKTDQNECYGKFLVADCLAAAKKRYTARLVEARNFEQPARDFQRESRRREVDEKEAQRADDQLRRAADEKAAVERYHAEEAAKDAERRQKLADKARRAEEGRQATAAAEARRQAKRQQRAQSDADRAAAKAARGAREERSETGP